MTAPAPMPAPASITGDAKLIWEIFEQQKCLAIRKNLDYGSSFRKPPAFAPGISPADAILVRMGDKLERIKTLRTRAASVSSEASTDTMLDLGTYAFLWVIAQMGCLTTEDDGKLYAGTVDCPRSIGEVLHAVIQNDFRVMEALHKLIPDILHEAVQRPGFVEDVARATGDSPEAVRSHIALMRASSRWVESPASVNAVAAAEAEQQGLPEDEIADQGEIDLPGIIVTDQRVILDDLVGYSYEIQGRPELKLVSHYHSAADRWGWEMEGWESFEDWEQLLPLYVRIHGGDGDWRQVFRSRHHMENYNPLRQGWHEGTAAIHIEPEHLAKHLSQKNAQERRILLNELAQECDWVPMEFEIEGNPTATLLVTLEGSIKATGSGHVEYPCRVRPKGKLPTPPWTVVFIHPDQMARDKDKEP